MADFLVNSLGLSYEQKSQCELLGLFRFQMCQPIGIGE